MPAQCTDWQPCASSFFADATGRCISCPPGTLCTRPNTTLAQLPVAPTFWRPSSTSEDVLSCPYAATCAGSTSMPDEYNESSISGCDLSRGSFGALCAICKEGSFMDEDLETCMECVPLNGALALVGIGLVAALLASVFWWLLKGRRIPRRWLRTWRRLLLAAARIDLFAKAKLLWTFYQIMCENFEIFSVTYPAAYQAILDVIGMIVNVKVLKLAGHIPNFSLECIGIEVEQSLAISVSVPLLATAVAIAVPLLGPWLQPRRDWVSLRYRLLSLWVGATFLLSPSYAAFGFEFLSPCDCFRHAIGAEPLCVSSIDREIECPATPAALDDPRFAVYARSRRLAHVAIAMHAVAVPMIWTLLLLACRRDVVERRPPSRLTESLEKLFVEYTPGWYFWELVELARKLVLTGVLAAFPPGDVSQLAIALSTSFGMLTLQALAQPFKDRDMNIIATLSNAGLVFTFIVTAFSTAYRDGFQAGLHSVTRNGAPSEDDPFLYHFSTLAVVGAVLATTTPLSVAFLLLIAVRQAQVDVPMWNSDGTEVEPPPLPPGAQHVFLCHATGAVEPARAMRARLAALLPTLKVFLVEDELGVESDHARLCALVDRSEVVVVLLTGSTDSDGTPRSNVFRSSWCESVLRRALERQKVVVAMLEVSSAHGAVPLAAHRDACEQLGLDFGSLDVVTCRRSPEYMTVTMRILLQRVLASTLAERTSQLARRRRNSLFEDSARSGRLLQESLYIPSELGRLPLRLRPPEAGAFHCYVSPHNMPGGDELVQQLRMEAARVVDGQAAGELCVCTDPRQRRSADCFLLYLNRFTKLTPPASAQLTPGRSRISFEEQTHSLHAELSAALREGQPVRVVHEQREGPQHGAVDFMVFLEGHSPPPAASQRHLSRRESGAGAKRPEDGGSAGSSVDGSACDGNECAGANAGDSAAAVVGSVTRQTPVDLLQLGLFNLPAIPLYGDEFSEASLRHLLQAICESHKGDGEKEECCGRRIVSGWGQPQGEKQPSGAELTNLNRPRSVYARDSDANLHSIKVKPAGSAWPKLDRVKELLSNRAGSSGSLLSQSASQRG